MTKNQIAYWELQETKRHQYHQDTELTRQNTETQRHDITTELEIGRHNLTTEQLESSRQRETVRHDIATEGLTSQQLREVGRHNRATEDVAYSNLNLGYATLAESTRSHKANEQLTERGQNISVLNTGINAGSNLAGTLISGGMSGVNRQAEQEIKNQGRLASEDRRAANELARDEARYARRNQLGTAVNSPKLTRNKIGGFNYGK